VIAPHLPGKLHSGNIAVTSFLLRTGIHNAPRGFVDLNVRDKFQLRLLRESMHRKVPTIGLFMPSGTWSQFNSTSVLAP